MAAGMLDNIYVTDSVGSLRLASMEASFEASIRVFEGEFRAEDDNEKLVEPVLGLWAMLINGRHGRSKELYEHIRTIGEDTVFPTKYFAGLVPLVHAILAEGGTSLPEDNTSLKTRLSSSPGRRNYDIARQESDIQRASCEACRDLQTALTPWTSTTKASGPGSALGAMVDSSERDSRSEQSKLDSAFEIEPLGKAVKPKIERVPADVPAHVQSPQPEPRVRLASTTHENGERRLRGDVVASDVQAELSDPARWQAGKESRRVSVRVTRM